MDNVAWKKARKLPVDVEFREVIPNCTVFRSGDKLSAAEMVHVGGVTRYAFPGEDYIVKDDEKIYLVKKADFSKAYELLDSQPPVKSMQLQICDLDTT